MKKLLFIFCAIILIYSTINAQIVLDTNDYVTMTSQEYDSSGWLFNTPDSVKITVTHKLGRCFVDWFNDADTSCALVTGATTYMAWSMKVKDIDADSTEGMYQVTAEFYDDAPRPTYDRHTFYFYKNNGGLVDLLFGADSTGWAARAGTFGWLALMGGNPDLQATPQDMWRGIDTIGQDTSDILAYLSNHSSGADSGVVASAVEAVLNGNIKIDIMYDTAIAILDTLQKYDEWLARQAYIQNVVDSVNAILDTLQRYDEWLARQATLSAVASNVTTALSNLSTISSTMAKKSDFDTLSYLMGYVYNAFSRSVYYGTVDTSYIRAPGQTGSQYIARMIRYINAINGLPDSAKIVR